MGRQRRSSGELYRRHLLQITSRGYNTSRILVAAGGALQVAASPNNVRVSLNFLFPRFNYGDNEDFIINSNDGTQTICARLTSVAFQRQRGSEKCKATTLKESDLSTTSYRGIVQFDSFNRPNQIRKCKCGKNRFRANFFCYKCLLKVVTP